jgi:hypothetical protein
MAGARLGKFALVAKATWRTPRARFAEFPPFEEGPSKDTVASQDQGFATDCIVDRSPTLPRDQR